MPKIVFPALTALICCLNAHTALAQTASDIKANPVNSAYLQDARGVIARTPFGLCWRSGSWTPADATIGCDGELAPPIAKPTAPPIVASTPAATPAPSTAPIAPKRCDFAVTLKNDQTFGFNKAVMTDAAKQRIDEELTAKLAACARIDSILVTGHADRLGSQQYNQKLSEKRADAVAAYLASKGVAAPIDTLGAGKTQSVTSCSEKLGRAALIRCLGADRRVVVDVRGTAN